MRAFIAPILPAARWRRRGCDGAAGAVAALAVRRATHADAGRAARCMARVFRDAEADVFGRPDPVTMWLVTYFSWLDMVSQLSRRLETAREGGGIGGTDGGGGGADGGGAEENEGRNDAAGVSKGVSSRDHVLLLAEDEEKAPGVVLACLEMGVVNVPRLFTDGMLSEIDQWGRKIEDAPSSSPQDDKAVLESAGGVDENERAEAQTPTTATEGRDGTVDRAVTNVDLPYIGNLAVAAKYRRSGLASRLVAEAEAIGASWGYSAVCLHVDADSRAATSLYARLGYRCAAREPSWYRRAGRVRRLFLRKDVGVDSPPVSLDDWEAADVAEVSRKMNLLEYFRYCLSDLGTRRKSTGR